MAYPALILAIVVVGSVLVFFARGEKAASANDAPIANQDHWHAAAGIDICGTFEPNPADVGPDTKGIHTHQDGLIHIHPFVGAAAGENATFSVFADQISLEVTDDSMTLPDGTTYTNGDDCETEDGETEPGRVALYVWPPQATDATEPEIITTNILETRFSDDGQTFVLAFVPEGTEVQLPPSVDELANPADLAGEAPDEGSTEFTTTVPGGDETTTTAPAETTTTEPAG